MPVYMHNTANKNLSEADKARKAEGGVAAIENDILRSALQSETDANDEEGLPAEVMDELAMQGARIDITRENLNKHVKEASEMHTSVLDLAANMEIDYSKSADDLEYDFADAEELATEVPHAFGDSEELRSREKGNRRSYNGLSPLATDAQKATIKKVVNDAKALGKEAKSLAFEAADYLSEPDSTSRILPGAPMGDEIERTRPFVENTLSNAAAIIAKGGSTEGDWNSSLDLLLSAFDNRGPAGNQTFLMTALFEADAPLSFIEKVCSERNMSVADFADYALDAMDRTLGDDGFSQALVEMAAKVPGYDEKIVGLAPLADPDQFFAYAAMVRSYNAMVDFHEARDALNTGDVTTQEHLDALRDKPLLAKAEFQNAKSTIESMYAANAGLGNTDGQQVMQGNETTLFSEHSKAMVNAEADGLIDLQMRQGFVPGVTSDDAILAHAAAAAEEAIKLAEAADEKAKGIGDMGGALDVSFKSLSALRAFIKVAKSPADVQTKIAKAAEVGLVSDAGVDATMAVNGVLKSATGGAKNTLDLLADAMETYAAPRIDQNHWDVTGGMKWAKRANGLRNIASKLEKAGVVGDVISLAGATRKLINGEGDTFDNVLDVASGAVGLAGVLAGGSMATAAGPIGWGIAYVQLLNAEFKKLGALDRAARSAKALESFQKINTSAQGSMTDCLRAASAATMQGKGSDEATNGVLEERYAAAINDAAFSLVTTHDKTVSVLSGTDYDPMQRRTVGDEGEFSNWPEKRDGFKEFYEKEATKGLGKINAASGKGIAGQADLKSGSTKLFSAIGQLSTKLEIYAKNPRR